MDPVEGPPKLNSRVPWSGLLSIAGALVSVVVVAWLLSPLFEPAVPLRVVRELPEAHTAKFTPIPLVKPAPSRDASDAVDASVQ